MPPKKTQWTLEDPIVRRFKTEISDQAQLIDGAQKEDWKSLTLGWALGQGMPIKEARSFAFWIRHAPTWADAHSITL